MDMLRDGNIISLCHDLYSGCICDANDTVVVQEVHFPAYYSRSQAQVITFRCSPPQPLPAQPPDHIMRPLDSADDEGPAHR